MKSAHSKVVAALCVMVFALMAVLSVVFTDLNDRELPQGANTQHAIDLDFSRSSISDEAAFEHLAEISEASNLGLAKLAGDLRGDNAGQVIVELTNEPTLPSTIPRFGDIPDAEVLGLEALEHSFANGRYLVTQTGADTAELYAWLAEQGVGYAEVSPSPFSTLRLITAQPAFFVCFLATLILLSTVVVYWMATRARRRSLQVLTGSPSKRIIVEDLVTILVPVTLPALVVGAAALIYIALGRGKEFIGHYAMTFGLLSAAVVCTMFVGVLLISAASWPSTAVLARRVPPVRNYQKVSTALKAITFLVILAAVAPAYTAWKDAQDSAGEQSQWKLLSEQVSLAFTRGATDEEFAEIKGAVDETARIADEREVLSLSYSWTGDFLSYDLPEFPQDENIAIVNEQWLRLLSASENDMKNIALSDFPVGSGQYVEAHLELWQRPDNGEEILNQVEFRRYESGQALPVVEGGTGQLVFANQAYLIVVPSVDVFNDDFLGSIATSSNLIFSGLDQTEALVEETGLKSSVRVQYMAEDGLLRAQFSAYFAWIQGASLLALTSSLVIIAAVGAAIAALLNLRRDYQFYIAGESPHRIIGNRVLPEALAVLVLTAGAHAVLSFTSLEGVHWVWAAAALGLGVSVFSHGIARRLTFKASLRRTV